jgi:hypothetical protein
MAFVKCVKAKKWSWRLDWFYETLIIPCRLVVKLTTACLQNAALNPYDLMTWCVIKLRDNLNVNLTFLIIPYSPVYMDWEKAILLVVKNESHEILFTEFFSLRIWSGFERALRLVQRRSSLSLSRSWQPCLINSDGTLQLHGRQAYRHMDVTMNKQYPYASTMWFSKDADEVVAVWMAIYFLRRVTHKLKPLHLTFLVSSDRMLVSEIDWRMA